MMKGSSWPARLAVLLVTLLFALGCGGGGSSGDFTSTASTAAATGPAGDADVGAGSVTFHFIKAQVTLVVPLETTRLVFRFFAGPDGTGEASQPSQARDFAERITISPVLVGTRSIVVTAFSSDGVPLLESIANIDLAPGETVDATFSSTKPITLQTLSVIPETATISIGQTRAFSAVATYSNAQSFPAVGVNWSSALPDVASIGAGTGVATGLATGETIIRASIGSVNDEASLTVSQGTESPGSTEPPVVPDGEGIPPSGGGGGGGGGGGDGTQPVVNRLRFSTFPLSSQVTPWPADTDLTLSVELLDGQGNRLSNAADNVTIALESSAVPVNAALTGTSIEAAGSGVASFTNLGVNKLGSYRFRASANGFRDAVSPALFIGPGTPSKLAFVSYPLVATVEEVTTPIVVELQDSKGNPVDPGATTYPVSLGITPSGPSVHDGANNPVTGDISGSPRVTFFDTRIDTAGTFRLTASTNGGILPATMLADLLVDTPPNLGGPPEEIPAQITYGSPFPALQGTAGTPLGPLTVEVRNVGGDIITSATGVVQIEVCGCNPAPGALYEDPTTVGASGGVRVTTLSAPVVNGVASFGNAVNVIRAGEWTLAAVYSKGSAYTVSQVVRIVPGPTARFTFTPQPQPPGSLVTPARSPDEFNFADAPHAGTPGPNPGPPNPVAAEALDQFGNRSLYETRPINLAFNTDGRPLLGTTTATPGIPEAGLATFTNIFFPTGRLGVHQLVAGIGNITGLSAPFSIIIEPTSLLSSGEIDFAPVSANNPNTTSADGRYVVFEKAAIDSNGSVTGYHVYRRDRQTGVTLKLDPGPDTAYNFAPAISPNGQFVSWTCNAEYNGISAPISPRTAQPSKQIYRWSGGSVTLMSPSLTDPSVGADDDCETSDVNDSGVVVFDSRGANLAADHRGAYQVYTNNGGIVQRISESAPGVASNSGLFSLQAQPSIANTGHVVWIAYAPDLPGDWAFVGFGLGVYRRLPSQPTVQLVNENPAFPDRVVNGFTQYPAISDNGRFVCYGVQTGDLPSDSTTRMQIYRRDCDGPVTAFVQVSEGGGGAGLSLFGSGSAFPSLSADGRYVAFASTEGLRGIPLPSPGTNHIYRRDCDSSTVVQVNLSPFSVVPCSLFSCWPSIASANPTLVHFYSDLFTSYLAQTGQSYMTFTP